MTNVIGIANDAATVSGRVLTITDASYEMADSVRFNVDPMQSGSGVPSPTNVRPFRAIPNGGSVVINRTGVNVLDVSKLNIYGNHKFDSNGTVITASQHAVCNTYVNVIGNATYNLQLYKEYNYSADMMVVFYDIDKLFISASQISAEDSDLGLKSASFTTPDGCYFIRFSIPQYYRNLQLEFGNSASEYEPYSGQRLLVFCGYNKYAGVVEPSPSGSLAFSQFKYYASYNGEALVGPWYSSMDVYEEGTTPTIGAEVIDAGTVAGRQGLNIKLRTTIGVNKIWIEQLGDISVTYRTFSVFNDVANLVYTEQVNTESQIKPGAVCAGCLRFDLFNENGESISAGDLLEYYQIGEDNTQTIKGVFNVTDVDQRRAKQVITAYDNIIKLDVDFSRKLAQLQNSFPISGTSLLAAACQVAGINYYLPPLDGPGSLLYHLEFQRFYSDRVTCRNIISWLAETVCCFVQCNTVGEIGFNWYSENEDYRIYPTSGSSGDETYVYYKMNGLSYGDEISAAITYVKIGITNNPANDYYYPASASQTYARDTTGHGDLELLNMEATDIGSHYGQIILRNPLLYTFDSTGEGNLSVLEEEQSVPNYIISDNILLTDASDSILESVAKNIYDTLNAFPAFRNTQVSLFRFFNPFQSGEIVKVTDVLGTSFVFPVTKLELSSDSVVLSSDNIYYDM